MLSVRADMLPGRDEQDLGRGQRPGALLCGRDDEYITPTNPDGNNREISTRLELKATYHC